MDLSRIKDYLAAFVCLAGSATVCIVGIVAYHVLK